MSDLSMHARATSLAQAAMSAAALLPATGETDYARGKRLYEEARMRNRAEGQARHAAHNRALRVDAAIRRHGGFQESLPF